MTTISPAVDKLAIALAILKAQNASRMDISILDEDFQKQSEFIRHDAKHKALWCTRRSAKSYTAGLGLFQTSLSFPGCNCLYLGLTRQSVKNIIWKDILKVINQRHALNAEFNGTELSATLPNGSIIYITGVDANEDEMQKLLGKKWKLVIVDEAQAFSIDLRNLIYGVLGPALADENGQAWIMGTSGNITQGLFYDVTNGVEPGWELFQWTAYDNPYMKEKWTSKIAEIQETRPAFMETALFKQWYLNQWVIDEDAKVYKFDVKRNTSLGLYPGVLEWHYVLGLDLAHSPDSTAFIVACYSSECPILYIVYAYKQIGMDITQVAEFIKKLEKTYKFELKVVDGAAKQAVAELNNRQELNLLASDKKDKVDHILLMNDDFIQGHIQLLTETKPLQQEYAKLVWDADASGNIKVPKKENPTLHNDCADATLYVWRNTYQYLYRAPMPFKDMTKQENWEPKHIERLVEQAKAKDRPPDELELTWEQTWDEEWGQ